MGDTETNIVRVFVDTNCLLHYPPLKDIDWPAHLKASQVELIICLQVVRELDDKKNDSRLKTRAERAIREITQAIENNGTIRKNTTVSVYNRELRNSDFPITLSPDSGDDRIVHFVRMYISEHPGENVCVATEDLGMSLRCKLHDIRTIAPPESMRLDSPQSDLERKYKEAIQEIASLKSQRPAIELYIAWETEQSSPGTPSKYPITRSIKRTNIDELVISEATDLRNLIGNTEKSDVGQMPPSHMLFSQGSLRARRNNFESECEKYLPKFRSWLLATEQYTDAHSREFEFYVIVKNSGRGIAQDVEVQLHFPPLLSHICGERQAIGNVPTSPPQPKRPIPQAIATVVYGMDWMRKLETDLIRPHFRPIQTSTKEWTKIHGSDTEGYVVHIYISQLNHHKEVEFGPFRAGFISWDLVRSFEITSTITSASLPDVASVKIPFLVELRELSDGE